MLHLRDKNVTDPPPEAIPRFALALAPAR